MKKYSIFALCGCMAINGVFADALNSQLNPKAVRKVVSSFATAVASGADAKNTVGYESIKKCLLKYVSKDGKFDTNITVKQFGSCCMQGFQGPEMCKKMIEDVVFEHNMLAGKMRPVPTLCTPEDLNNMKLANAGHYIYVNGVKKCAATSCMHGAYLARSIQKNRYGQSDGYCLKGDDPWIIGQDGKFVLKSDVKETETPDDKQSQEQQSQEQQSQEQQSQEQQSQEQDAEVVGDIFAPNPIMLISFYNQYCVDGTGNLICTKKGNVISSALKCTTKPAVDTTKIMIDANAVCNGTFVASGNNVATSNENAAAVDANAATAQDAQQQPVIQPEQEQLATLNSGNTGFQVATVSADGIIPAAVNTPEMTREEALRAANESIADNAESQIAEAKTRSEKTQAKLDALKAQQSLTQDYIDAESDYDISDVNAAIEHAQNVKDAQKDMAKLQRKEERLNSKLERQKKQEDDCAAKHGTLKAGSCWCDDLILTGNMDCAEIKAKQQARQDKRDAKKETKALEKEKSDLEKQIKNYESQIKKLQDAAKADSDKLKAKRSELSELDTSIDTLTQEAKRLRDKQDSLAVNKLQELQKQQDKRPGLAQQVADLESKIADSDTESKVKDLLDKIQQNKSRIAEIDSELSEK